MALSLVLFLAVLQGVAEFLPISSSGHLRIAEAVFGIEEPQVLFDLLLHLGTLAAVIFVYRAMLWRMTRATVAALARPRTLAASYRASLDFRLFVLVCLGMVPTSLIALAATGFSDRWARVVALVGTALLVTAALLVVLGRVLARRAQTADRPETQGLALEALTWKHALIIGSVQGVSAAVRGISRSGSTISGGVFSGLRQDAAATYSFLLSIPAILGALVVSLKRYEPAPGASDVILPGLIGAAVAAVVGVIALRLLLRMLRQGQLGVFARWCAAVGVAAIVWDLTR